MDISSIQLQGAYNSREQTDIKALQAKLRGLAPKDKEEKLSELQDACKGFESIFISKMWSKMRANIPKEGYLHSKQEEQYMGMFDKEFADKMADSGGIGLGRMLFDSLKSRLEEASEATRPDPSAQPVSFPPGFARTEVQEAADLPVSEAMFKVEELARLIESRGGKGQS